MSTTSGSVDEPPSKRARIDPEAPKDEGNATSSVEAKSQDINPNSLAFRLAQYVETSSESLVGISGYVNPNLPPFDSGIIKHRFTDFLVWEIAKGGEVVRLKDIAKPVAPSEPESQKEENEAAQNGKDGGNDAEAKDEKELPKLEDFVTPEKAKEVQAFFEAGKASNVSVSTDVSRTEFEVQPELLKLILSNSLSSQKMQGKGSTRRYGNYIKASWNRRLRTKALSKSHGA